MLRPFEGDGKYRHCYKSLLLKSNCIISTVSSFLLKKLLLNLEQNFLTSSNTPVQNGFPRFIEFRGIKKYFFLKSHQLLNNYFEIQQNPLLFSKMIS